MNEPKESLSFVKWLLSADHPLRNAASGVVGIAFATCVFIAAKEYGWFPEIAAAGPIAVVAGIFCAFLMAFLMTLLVWGCVAGVIARSTSRRKDLAAAYADQVRIHDTLGGLSEWPRRFVQRFILENRRLIAYFEVGGYSAIWEPEMDVLLRKRVIFLHPGGMYELSAKYRLYLERHWDQETGRLA